MRKSFKRPETPANGEGLGTTSRLKKNAHSISGVEILIGETPDLVHLAVRLSPDPVGPCLTDRPTTRRRSGADWPLNCLQDARLARRPYRRHTMNLG